MRKMKFFLAIVLLSMIVLSCQRREKQDVLMVYPNWSDGLSITYLAKVMLEERGYKVSVKRLEPGPIYATLSRGDADVYMGAWLPNTHESYWGRFHEKLDILGNVFDDGITGLVVPDYVTINSIEELNRHRSHFDGKIYGIAAGAGIHGKTEMAIKEYNLEYQQLSSSETSMLTALKKAIANEEWIVITGWKPHFMWSDFNLKTLDDPLRVYPTDTIKIVSRKGFAAEKPELALFFNNFHLNEKMLGELMNEVASERNPEIGAKRFYRKYENVLFGF